MRRLPQLLSAATPPRSIPSCLPLTSRFQPILRTASNPLRTPVSNTQPITRPFSNSPHLQSSPFRLSSTPSQSPSTAPSDPPSDAPEGIYYSPYKPKRVWPPDLSKLSPKHQFRLERKYRRRAALKYARPKWVKATKLAQWGGIIFVLLYALLFMEWDERGGKDIDEFRENVFGTIKGAFSAPPSQASMRKSEESSR
ncbi:hypothetical protein BJY04DRAFT_188702 [Aspergillus karnatakaensis]|uniref:uncharacterized protein n=1 Tax=Aspergillus karnatakaensis TaxID=1810916 RepID=UPI003CCCB43F